MSPITRVLLSATLLAHAGPRVDVCAQFSDLAESNALQWGTFASDDAARVVSNDTARVRSGVTSIKFVTQSGFDTGVTFPAAGNANWNLASLSANFLFLWVYGENQTPVGWQGNQPIIVLKSSNGSFQYEPTSQEMPNFAWRLIKVPLAGDANWIRTTTGNPSLSDIDQIEIHQDTWDAGFTVWYDGVRFASFTPGGLPPPGPPPPSGVDPDAIAPRVLLYICNPMMPGGQRLNEFYGWGDPLALTDQIIEDFRVSSHDRARFEIVEVIDDSTWPYLDSGFQYTSESFQQAWANHDFEPGTFDYARFVSDHNLGARVDSGDIDEVWVYSFPGAGMFESAMAGKGAFWVNGGPYPDAGGDRAFVIMGWNYERGVGEAIHSFGHRAESTLADRVYGQWCQSRCNTWSRFALLDLDISGQGGVGNVHFPVNGEGDYDYANGRFVLSNADAWLAYPNLNNNTRSINFHEWSPDESDPQRQYLNWWYAHMPHVGSKAPDQYLANWWRYLCDVDQIKSGSASLYYATGEISTAIMEPACGTFVDSSARIVASAQADGALGRVDFYANGVYIATDTMSPFVWDWNTAPWPSGVYTVVAKAHELQNGTQAVSAPILVHIRHPCPADLNTDALVDDADFVIFAGAYNILDCADPAMTSGCPADLNADSLVDDSDFVAFVAAYDALLCP